MKTKSFSTADPVKIKRSAGRRRLILAARVGLVLLVLVILALIAVYVILAPEVKRIFEMRLIFDPI